MARTLGGFAANVRLDAENWSPEGLSNPASTGLPRNLGYGGFPVSLSTDPASRPGIPFEPFPGMANPFVPGDIIQPNEAIDADQPAGAAALPIVPGTGGEVSPGTGNVGAVPGPGPVPGAGTGRAVPGCPAAVLTGSRPARPIMPCRVRLPHSLPVRPATPRPGHLPAFPPVRLVMPCRGRPIRGAPAPRPIAAGRPRTTRSSRSSGSRTAPRPPAPASRVVAAGSWPERTRIRGPRRPVRRTYLYREGRRTRRGRSSRHRDPRRTGSAPRPPAQRGGKDRMLARVAFQDQPVGPAAAPPAARPPQAPGVPAQPDAMPDAANPPAQLPPAIPGTTRASARDPRADHRGTARASNRQPDRQRRTDGARRGRRDSPASSCPSSIP